VKGIKDNGRMLACLPANKARAPLHSWQCLGLIQKPRAQQTVHSVSNVWRQAVANLTALFNAGRSPGAVCKPTGTRLREAVMNS
jgi:hypothetical protein